MPEMLQKQDQAEPSTSSPSAASSPLAEFELKFEERDYPHFMVEFIELGADIVYHFWPPGQQTEFCRGFAVLLERGFVATLPPDATVKAGYTDIREAIVLHTEGVGTLVPQRDKDNKNALPRETFHVRVVGGTLNPLADTFLKKRLFENIEAAIAQGL